MRSAREPVGIVMLALLIGGCGSSTQRAEDPDVGASPPAATSTPDEPTPSDTAATATPDSPILSDTAGTAVADLAERLGVEPAEVEVVAEEEFTWSDGSLGCAEPGGMYTQALIDGSRITLRVDGIDYHYHSGGSPESFLCEEPTE